LKIAPSIMHSKTSKILVLISLLWGAQGTFALNDEGRVEVFDASFTDFFNRGGKGKEVEEMRRESARLTFAEWTDEELTATAIDWAFAESNDPYVGLNLRNFLKDLNRPTNSEEFRKHLRETSDSRKAYKLLHLTKLFPDEEFVAELAPLLYNKDLNSDPIQEWEPGRICDNAYNKIASYLQLSDVGFIPPKLTDVKNPDEEAIQPMIRWLAANWNGCEHLITTKARSSRDYPQDRFQSSSASKNAGREAEISRDSDVDDIDWRWIVAGMAVFASAVVYGIVKGRASTPT